MILLVIGTVTVLFLFWPIRAPGKVTIVNADVSLNEPSTYLTADTPRLSGLILRLNCFLTNTRFGLLFLIPSTARDDFMGLDKFGRQVCTLPPTFWPVRRPLPGTVELAGETVAPLDTSHLQDSFQPDQWRPTTIDDYVSAYVNKVTTPVMIAEDIIAKIKLVNDEMNIFVDWNENMIMQQAVKSEERYHKGDPLGPFDGVPVVIKDQLDIKGLTTRCGVELSGKVAVKDSVVVERLRRQGMIILGLVNMHPLGAGVTGVNPSKYAGFCPNPFNRAYHPGASSSGTAVALASGLAPIGIGSDGGGSVRIPATFCALAGLKPTAGRIPQRGYSGGGTNATIGPMANTMVDCAKLYAVIAGPDFDEASRLSWYQPKVTVPKRTLKSLSGLRIGIDYDWIKITSQDILARFNESVEKLRCDGAEVVAISLPDPFNRDAAHPLCFIGEMIPAVNDHLNERTKALNEEVTSLFQAASEVRSWHYGLAQRLRTKFIRAFDQIFQNIDLIATPATACGTFKISDAEKQYGSGISILMDYGDIFMAKFSNKAFTFSQNADPQCGLLDIKNSHLTSYFNRICNFTGVPAISTPTGRDSNEMPIGIQFIAKWWDEEKLFEIGMYWESKAKREKPEFYLENKLI